MTTSHKLLFALKSFRTIPAYIIWKTSKSKDIIYQDMCFWKEIRHMSIEN